MDEFRYALSRQLHKQSPMQLLTPGKTNIHGRQNLIRGANSLSHGVKGAITTHIDTSHLQSTG